MTELDGLPPEQRAVLSLVLDVGKSYGEVAEILDLPESEVRDRAHTALDALAGDPARPGASGSASLSARKPLVTLALTISRTTGALVLGAIVAVIAIVVILLSSGGGGSGSRLSTSGRARSLGLRTVALSPVEGTHKANGKAYMYTQRGRPVFYISARGLPPSSGFSYVVWLYNSATSAEALGRTPAVGSAGSVVAEGPLPSNAGNYHKLIITRETSNAPSHPGPVVLSGTLTSRGRSLE
jgi:hypothetical protein